jgi:hypothetical protein
VELRSTEKPPGRFEIDTGNRLDPVVGLNQLRDAGADLASDTGDEHPHQV